MSIRTYDPSVVVALIGTVPLFDWDSLQLETVDSRLLFKGIDGEYRRFNTQNAEITELVLEIPTISPQVSLLKLLQLTDLPFQVAITRLNPEDKAATVITTPLITEFLWPAIFMSETKPTYNREASNTVFTIQGIQRSII